MESPPFRGHAPPVVGIRRSVTMPPRALSFHERPSLQTSDPTVDVLYSHPKARIVSFEPRPTDAKRSVSSRASHDYDYPVDTVETLPRASHNEEILATGPISIVKRPESTSFLMAGLPDRTRPIHALMRNSQCWCVDGQAEFVLRAGYLKYERIELPYETEEDKQKVQQLKDVLAGILRFEVTPCPFKRGVRVDLPEIVLTPRRKGQWRRTSGSVTSSPIASSPSPLVPTKSRNIRAVSENVAVSNEHIASSAAGQEWEVPAQEEPASEEESINDGSSPHSPVTHDDEEEGSSREDINENAFPAVVPPSSLQERSVLVQDAMPLVFPTKQAPANIRGTQPSSVDGSRSESGSGDGEDGSRSGDSEDSASEQHSEGISDQQALPPLPSVSPLAGDEHESDEKETGSPTETPVESTSESVPRSPELAVESVDLPEPTLEISKAEAPGEEKSTSTTEQLPTFEVEHAITPTDPRDLPSNSPTDVRDDISISSYADSFHSLSSLEQYASASSPTPLEHVSPTPRASTFSPPEPTTPSPTSHRRDVSEITVTDDPSPGPSIFSKPLTPSPSSPPSELRHRLPRPLSPSQNPSSGPPSPPLSPIYPSTLPTQILDTARHLMLGIGVKVPIQATLLVIHILSRIRGGATLSELLSGELFHLPEEWRGGLGKKGRATVEGGEIEEDDEEEEWEEDDFGVPIRPAKRIRDPEGRFGEGGARVRHGNEDKRDEEDEGDRDSLFDLD